MFTPCSLTPNQSIYIHYISNFGFLQVFFLQNKKFEPGKFLKFGWFQTELPKCVHVWEPFIHINCRHWNETLWYSTNIFNVPYFPFHNLATLVMMMTGLNDSSNLRLQFHKMLIKCKTYKEIVQKEHSDFISINPYIFTYNKEIKMKC